MAGLHEQIHLLERNRSESFAAQMDRHFPDWREIRRKLNGQILDCMDCKTPEL